MYVYLNSEPGLYTVGFFRPDGRWESESDHSTKNEAAKRVAFLNGKADGDEIRAAIQQAYAQGYTAGQGLKGDAY